MRAQDGWACGEGRSSNWPGSGRAGSGRAGKGGAGRGRAGSWGMGVVSRRDRTAWRKTTGVALGLILYLRGV